MKKRIVSLILVTLLVAGLLATAVFAGAEVTYVDGQEYTIAVGGEEKTVVYHAAKAATCVAKGNYEFWQLKDGIHCYVRDGDGFKYETSWSNIEIPVDPNAHTALNKDDDSYKVEGGNATCEHGTQYYKSCAVCGAELAETFFADDKATHTLTEHEAAAATCTADGNIAYWSCDVCNKNFSDAAATTEITTSVTVTKLGHDWKEKTWTWTPAKNGGWNVTLVLKCERVGCTTTCEPKVTVTSAVTTKPTATKDGVRTWTATATQDGKTYTSTKETTEPKTGVDYYYGAVLYFNSNGGSTVTPIYTNTTKTVDLTKYIPTRRGYTFAGWYADARLTTPISSITLYPTGYRYNNYNSYTVYAGWYDDTWCSACSFWDVDYYDWYHDEIRYVVDNGIMEGISSNWFAPEEAMTRADLVVAMYRIAGSPSTRYTGVFTDVKSTADYAIAVEWAAKYGIVNGVGNKKFDPNSAVTREQMAAIFYRFGKYVDKYGFTPYRTTGFFWNFSKLAFADTRKISNYAKDPVAWCVKNGIFYGDNSNRFNPQDNTTRGECAAILYRFCK